MLSITKINAANNQSAGSADGKGYLHYLGGSTTRQRGDFDDYARGKGAIQGPPPFWACKGPALLGLDDIAEAEQVDRLARGFHPVTGVPLVKGAGDGHVMGLDMTFSAPKDFSAVDVLLRLDKGDMAHLDGACKVAGLSRSDFVKLHIIPLLAALTPRFVDVDRARIARTQTLATFLGFAIDTSLADPTEPQPFQGLVADEFDQLFGHRLS